MSQKRRNSPGAAAVEAAEARQEIATHLRGGVLVTRVPRETHAEFKSTAAARGLSIEEVLRRLAWLYLGDEKLRRRVEDLHS